MLMAGNAKLRVLGVAAAGLIAVSASACDATSGPAAGAPDGARQVTVVGSGQVQGVPDTLTADVAMEFTAPDVSGALNQSSQRQQAVIDALVAIGHRPQGHQHHPGQRATPVHRQHHLGLPGQQCHQGQDPRHRQGLRQTLALIASTGGDATRINSVDYSIEDDSDLVRDARARAFDDAKNRADQYAGLSGLHLGKVISISEQSGGSTPPTPTPMPRAAMRAVPLEPGQQTVDFSVTVIWELT